MKNRLRKIVAVVLGLVILISSNGIVLASHICFSKSESDVSFFGPKGCCSKMKRDCHSVPNQEHAFAKKCCELKITFHQVDVSSFSYKTNFNHEDGILQLLSIQRFSFSKKYPEPIFLKKAPPKPGGRILLANISLLQI